MSFIRCQVRNNVKYAYEITSYRDPETKKKRQKSKYLGIMSSDGTIMKKKNVKEKIILDFGDYFLLNEFIKKINLHKLIIDLAQYSGINILPLLFYRICSQSAMHNALTWFEGNAVNLFFKNADLSSQNISRNLKVLGENCIQEEFFKQYLNSNELGSSIIIDATSLPNKGATNLNAWGKNSGSIDKQIRLLFVIEQYTQKPLFYRVIPGNIIDISTLENTIVEITKLGVKSNFILLDAGYCSENNISDLYSNKINFLMRLPSNRKIYQSLITIEAKVIESVDNLIKQNNRALFVKKTNIDLYGYNGFAYIVLDPERKAKEIKKISEELQETEYDKKLLEYKFLCCGIMILISSIDIDAKEILTTYYLRQSVEQVFNFFKEDLDSLPLRCHSTESINGYLFLQFLSLLLFIELRNKLKGKYTVEQALLITRNLKCKVYDSEILTAELSKKQKEIYDLCQIVVPKMCGI